MFQRRSFITDSTHSNRKFIFHNHHTVPFDLNEKKQINMNYLKKNHQLRTMERKQKRKNNEYVIL